MSFQVIAFGVDGAVVQHFTTARRGARVATMLAKVTGKADLVQRRPGGRPVQLMTCRRVQTGAAKCTLTLAGQVLLRDKKRQ
ncbi:MAG: hypothetical protein IPJ61_19625 [Tessaracoccus sp.]|uniref:hypothetical protein n=1 Tax=Tessaracoccus sp. TaxID=1971211 RepID=UPI001EB824E8|nr:hypothetical protein [Tessaracoccus sp.]MBK7823197.1 hypothetical protein [Tessaracoccus sp.]